MGSHVILLSQKKRFVCLNCNIVPVPVVYGLMCNQLLQTGLLLG